MHEHRWWETRRHENDDRIRTREDCRKCEAHRFSCEAKRLDGEGLESWGPVGRKLYTEPRFPEKTDHG